MSNRNDQWEMLPGSRYYGKHSTGWVVLHNGHVVLHATSAQAKKEASAFMNKHAPGKNTLVKPID